MTPGFNSLTQQLVQHQTCVAVLLAQIHKRVEIIRKKNHRTIGQHTYFDFIVHIEWQNNRGRIVAVQISTREKIKKEKKNNANLVNQLKVLENMCA